MKISACYIVKNEENNIEISLESVKNIVDEIIIVDTGSTDGTIGIAEKFNAKIFSKPWNNDFSEARNEAIDHASGDWIIFLDADEFFTPETRSNIPDIIDRAEKSKFNTILVPLFNVDIDDDNRILDQAYSLRIFKRLPSFRYTGRIHEQLTDLDGKKMKMTSLDSSMLSIIHTGYSSNIQRKKSERNLQLLLAELETTQTPENLFPYLSETYYGLGNFEQAERYGLLDIATGRKSNTVASKSYRVLINMFKDKPEYFIDRFIVTKLAAKNFPEIPEFHADLGECYGQLGLIQNCVDSLEKCLKAFKKYDPNKNLEQSGFTPEMANMVRQRIDYWKSKLR